MTIDPHRTTAPIGGLARSTAERWTFDDLLRRSHTAAVTRAALAREVEEVAEVPGENLPAEEGVQIPVPSTRQLSIRKDPELDRVVVQVIDGETGEVVRQIPSEEWVRHLKRLKGAKGLFVDQKG